MNLLLDTNVLIWSAFGSRRLSSEVRSLINDVDNSLFFSVVSLWEIAIKNGLNRADFNIDVVALRSKFLENNYQELSIEIDHLVTLGGLPTFHKDPFDRLLIAQSKHEHLTLITSDNTIASYGGGIRKI